MGRDSLYYRAVLKGNEPHVHRFDLQEPGHVKQRPTRLESLMLDTVPLHFGVLQQPRARGCIRGFLAAKKETPAEASRQAL